ncbi:MAG: cell division protein FtsL [Shimia sp.]
MKALAYLLSAACVIALAVWAYSENYATQAAIRDVERLHRQIGQAQARHGILKAEWAYLNRPDRLRDLVDLNFERLPLVPLAPEQFGAVEQVPYPFAPHPLELLPIADHVDTAAEED